MEATKEIRIRVGWTGENFCAGWEDWEGGNVVVTASDLETLKKEFAETLRFHLEGCMADGDGCPQYLADGNYSLVYELDATALIRNAENYTTMSAISKVSGINAKQLSHYANGVKRPRPMQIEKIRSAIHTIGNRLSAMG